MPDFDGLTLLYVEDEDSQRELVRGMLEMDGARVIEAANGLEALTHLDQSAVDILISDIRMPRMDGISLAERVRRDHPEIPVVLCTAFTDTDYLLKAIELGVSAYVPKPLEYDRLAGEVERLARPVRQRQRIAHLEQEALRPFGRMLGDSPPMRALAAQARKLALTRYPMLLQGETGTGKSRLARLIHDSSPRASGPFVVAHLGAVPESTAESELFGHVKGAFTGAERVRLGLFRQASGGTLFLDDIDTAALTLQAKILHAVECGQVMPLGADQPVAVDVRILAASNTDLRAAAAGRFRQDLYYRLGNLALTLPALRERGEEIPSLARMFLRETCDDLGREVPVLDPAAAALLMAHSWPGNIRELKSLMRNLAVFAETAVTVEMVRNQIAQTPPDSDANRPHTSAVPTLEQAEIAAILAALRAAKGGKMEAARLLAIDYQRFKRKLLKYGLAG